MIEIFVLLIAWTVWTFLALLYAFAVFFTGLVVLLFTAMVIMVLPFAGIIIFGNWIYNKMKITYWIICFVIIAVSWTYLIWSI